MLGSEHGLLVGFAPAVILHEPVGEETRADDRWDILLGSPHSDVIIADGREEALLAIRLPRHETFSRDQAVRPPLGGSPPIRAQSMGGVPNPVNAEYDEPPPTPYSSSR